MDTEMTNNTPRARIMYYDRNHTRRQITIPRSNRDNVYKDILEFDRINGTAYYDEIKPWTIRKVVKLD